MADPITKNVLFVLHDTGETTGLLPVIAELGKNKRVKTRVLALSTARHLVDRANLPQNVVVETTAHKLSKPDVIVTGAMTQIQAELRQNYPNAKRVAFIDNLALPTRLEAQSKRDLVNHTDVLLVPNDTSQKAYQNAYNFTETKVLAAGQPVLSSAKKTSVEKKYLLEKLGLSAQKPILLYAGGYGKNYEKSFQIFCAAIKPIASHYSIVIALHPHRDNPNASSDEQNFEERMVQEFNFSASILSQKRNNISTDEILPAADLLISQNSTVAISSLCLGTPALYIDVANTRFRNAATVNNLIPQLSNSQEIQTWLATNTLTTKSERINLAKKTQIKLGLFKNATDNIMSFLLSDA